MKHLVNSISITIHVWKLQFNCIQIIWLNWPWFWRTSFPWAVIWCSVWWRSWALVLVGLLTRWQTSCAPTGSENVLGLLSLQHTSLLQYGCCRRSDWSAPYTYTLEFGIIREYCGLACFTIREYISSPLPVLEVFECYVLDVGDEILVARMELQLLEHINEYETEYEVNSQPTSLL